MRALLVVEATSAGVGRHVIDLSLGLRMQGHDVRVVWSPARSDEKFRMAMQYLQEIGGSDCQLPMQRGPSKSDIRVITELKKDVIDWKPDVIHAHSSKAGAVGRIAAKRAGVPSVYTPHAYITMSPGLSRKGYLLYKGVERYLARLGTHTICVSELEKRHAVDSLKLAPNTVTVVPNGITDRVIGDRTALRREAGATNETKLIGWVGRMGSQKNPLLMVRAFAHIAPREPDAILAMIGDGELRKATEDLARDSGVADRVRFLGAQDGATWMNAFDLFAMSSDYEGYPYVALEAAIAGLPLASTKMGAVDEIYEGGKGGFFAPVGDAAALGQAIESGLKANPPYATTTITIEEMVKRIATVYSSIKK